ncbi:hypothetical protein, partial [Pseudomonas sp. CHM02]|uniref:hypothetical protein n=1 Tax=Pseudomonas sp. CHM02 TaxID=1463662 RepID=UPI001C486053
GNKFISVILFAARNRSCGKEPAANTPRTHCRSWLASDGDFSHTHPIKRPTLPSPDPYKKHPTARQKNPTPAKPYKSALWPKNTPFWPVPVTIRPNTKPFFSPTMRG